MAVAVVRDINHDLINGGVVGDARNRAAILRDVVSIRTCGVEYQLLITADGGGSIQAGDRSGGIARHGGIALTRQGETEGIRIVPSAAIQHFFDMEQVFGYRRVRLCVVGVYKLGFFVFGIAVSNRGFQLIAFGIQRNRDGGGDICGIGHTIGGDTRLFDGVGVSTRLFVGDCTEIGSRCGFGYRCRCAVASGHRGIVVRRKGKGKSFAILPVTAGNALAYTQRGHGCTCKCVGEGYISGGYWVPLIAIPLIVGGRDGQGLRFRTLGRNLGFNQILFLAVSNISLIIIYFGKQVIIGLTMVTFQRIGNITKGNLTNRIVNGVCCVARHRDVGVAGQLCVVFVYRCSFEFEVELTVGQSHRIALLILVGFRSLNNERLGVILKGVGKCDILRICGCVITEYMLNTGGFHFQLAAAVVRDGNRHTVVEAVIRNTRNLILGGVNFGDVVYICAGLGEGNISEVKGNTCTGGGAIGSRHFVLNMASPRRQRCAIDGHQSEGKAIGSLPNAALQNLFAFERVIGVRRFYHNLSRLIGVCHRNFLGCTCRDCARAVIRNALLGIAGRQIFFRDGIGAAHGQTHNLGSLVGFQLESIAALDF